MSLLPLIRKLYFIILLGGTVLAAGDFSCGKDGTATAVFWRNAMLVEPRFAKADTTADNLLNKAYQNHLSRLKYTDINRVTGRRGIFNMGRNITFKVVVPINI